MCNYEQSRLQAKPRPKAEGFGLGYLMSGLPVPAQNMTSGAFFDAKASFSRLLDAKIRFPVENCIGYGAVYISRSPNTAKPVLPIGFLGPFDFHISIFSPSAK